MGVIQSEVKQLQEYNYQANEVVVYENKDILHIEK